MPSLTPVELHVAFVRSGRLGGRLCASRPWSEAREAALAEPSPPFDRNAQTAHRERRARQLESGHPGARIAFARTTTSKGPLPGNDPEEVEALSWKQMRLLAMQLTAPMLEQENAVAVDGNGTS